MQLDISGLLAIEPHGLCWSVGLTRSGRCECRIYERRRHGQAPDVCIIEHRLTYDDAVKRALARLEFVDGAPVAVPGKLPPFM